MDLSFDDVVLLLLAIGTLTGAVLYGMRQGLKALGYMLLSIAMGAALGNFADGTRAATVVGAAAGALGPWVYDKAVKGVRLVRIARILAKKTKPKGP